MPNKLVYLAPKSTQNSVGSCHFVNVLSFAKRSQNSNYCLSLTQDSQSESNNESNQFHRKI